MASNQDVFDWMGQQIRDMRAEMEQMRADIESLKIKHESASELIQHDKTRSLPDKKIRIIIPAMGLFDDFIGNNSICRAINTLFNTFRSNEFFDTDLPTTASHKHVFKIDDNTDADIIVLVSLRFLFQSVHESKYQPVMPRLINSDGLMYTGGAKIIVWPITIVASELYYKYDSWNIDGHLLIMESEAGTTDRGGLYYVLKDETRMAAMLEELKKALN